MCIRWCRKRIYRINQVQATKFYTSQNRLVTLNDYKAKVQEYYSNADAVAVWGGEDNDEYSKMFVSLEKFRLSFWSRKERSSNKLNALNMLTVKHDCWCRHH